MMTSAHGKIKSCDYNRQGADINPTKLMYNNDCFFVFLQYLDKTHTNYIKNMEIY